MSTSANESGFRFYSDPINKVSNATADCLVVKIPTGVNSKTQLLQILSKELRFPLYFGWNWDALSDCLRDLHWLENIRRVRIIHEALPFRPGWKKRALYINLLQQTVHSWNAQPGIQVEVLFPEAAKREVQDLLAQNV